MEILAALIIACSNLVDTSRIGSVEVLKIKKACINRVIECSKRQVNHIHCAKEVY